MDYLRFLSSNDPRSALPGTYDPVLVTLSIVIASLAAYAALGLAGRISAAENSATKRAWLTAGAVAMGIGIWAMHFIGMLAFRLPVPVIYDIQTTLLSMAPAILASGMALLVISGARIERRQLILAGTLMGIGIGTMHYTGMAAMRMAAVMLYDPVLFIASIIVAVVLATVSLYVHSLAIRRSTKSRNYWIKLRAALVMGLSVAGMHYTGMAAAYFFPQGTSPTAGPVLDPMLLGVLVGLATAMILGLAIFVAVVDRRLQAAAHSVRTSADRLQTIMDNTTSVIFLKDLQGRYQLINSQFEKVLNMTREAVVGKTDYDIWPEDAADTIRTNDQKMLETGSSMKFEEVFPHDDGLHTYISTKVPLRDPRGIPYALCGVATDITEILQLARERDYLLAHEIEIAKQVQQKLLPQGAPPLETLEYVGDCIQARSVGGDYYDFLDLGSGRLGLALADISGKGIAAALLMASLHANVRGQCMLAGADLPRLLHSVNHMFYESSDAGHFATFFFGSYKEVTRQFRYANCGHNPPVLLRANGAVERLEATATVLGMFEQWDCSIKEVVLAPGDILLIFSDGVTEAMNGEGAQFGDERLIETLHANRHLPVGALLPAIVAAVGKFSGPQQKDDQTLVVARAR